VFVCVVLALALVPSRAFAVSETEWLGRINEIRQGSQLPAVGENGNWSAGIAAHLNYLAQTPASYRTGAYASVHTENPASPYYSVEGDREGRSSDLTSGSSSNLDAINGWLTAPFHAIGMLRAGLQEVAFAREAPGGAAGLDVISGLSSSSPARQVLFPGPGSTIDLSRFGGESPTPIETCEAQHAGADYSSAGLSLIALLTEPPEPGLSASLTMPDGSQAASGGSDLCVVTADNFTSSDTIYGPTGQSILSSDMAVLVIPRRPLTSGRYAVDIAQPGKPDIAWSFNSEPPAEPDENISRRPRVRFGRPHFKRRFVGLTLDNSAGSSAVSFSVFCTSTRVHTFLVAAEMIKRARAHIRRNGVSRVTVRVGPRLVGSRTYRAPRFHRHGRIGA
jgi:hypothetical protein